MPSSKPELLKAKRQRYRAAHPEARHREWLSLKARGLLVEHNRRKRIRYAETHGRVQW